MKLLLAEDEKELSNALCAILKHSGYETNAAYDGKSALGLALENRYDVMIFDIMMPKMSGLEVLENVRKNGINTPVLLLTAKAQAEDKITGLDAGADDYLAKPFNTGELLARLRAMTRRNEIKAEDTGDIVCGNIKLDRTTFELSGPKASLRLAKQEFQLLDILIKNKNKKVEAVKTSKLIWGEEAEEDVIVIYIAYLRKKLKSSGSDLTISDTRGGYILEG
jgi:DNA-binding response OmpR family regulator